MTEISLAAESIGRFAGFPVTNALLTSWLVTGLLVVGALVLRRRIALVPRGAQSLVEGVVEFLLSLVDSVTGDRRQSEKVFPLIASLFLFIITLNWIGLLPGVGSIGLHAEHGGHPTLVPLFRGGNADLNSTLALALIAVVATHVFGLRTLGVSGHLGKFFNFKNPILFFVGILELVSECAKIISFSFRLFGNIFAGEVLLIVVAAIVPYVAPLPFLGLELFVGFIQALVFSVLTLVFLQIAATAHGEEHSVIVTKWNRYAEVA
jgi:F-type H+-transporting ATPase subunit a